MPVSFCISRKMNWFYLDYIFNLIGCLKKITFYNPFLNNEIIKFHPAKWSIWQPKLSLPFFNSVNGTSDIKLAKSAEVTFNFTFLSLFFWFVMILERVLTADLLICSGLYMAEQWFDDCNEEIRKCCDQALSMLFDHYGGQVVCSYFDASYPNIKILFLNSVLLFSFNKNRFSFCLKDDRCDCPRDRRDAPCSLHNNRRRVHHLFESLSWKNVSSSQIFMW